MKILHISASPKREGSSSWWLSQQIVGRLAQRAGHAAVTVRDLYADPIAHVDDAYAEALGSPVGKTDEGAAGGALGMSEQLIRELELADSVVIGTPMHNYTVPSALKAWIDHVVRVRRTFAITPDGKAGLLRDKPVYVGIAAGGRFSGPSARQADFLTPYLKAVLATIGLHDLRFYSMEGLAQGPDVVAAERKRMELVLGAAFSRA
ncbi:MULTISPECIES: FMN-dependent NADH-azoreductase [unclassified Herbaspirillum]|uniref:FMN-dependent NADH-azoreductase n=1 Tax=unclassified Herbaspirillum TaxID=2624150 RepID=UPI00115362A2|nr:MULTISPECIES: NAD(P)H-dependent oxidoreductase [unclassified Herbaspirillum]MBB5390842.1 FMN-dependent NADH-azoreductase [Herbaspirillum sp. SJZ102]TQK06368.1 FMN-dependent NADH-azoreductase [Herbaspirillum sp. SJZ130]TQK12154.1 FMN-dependent NADH-azoreductase [Herbaspirillum sp. SJZ106]